MKTSIIYRSFSCFIASYFPLFVISINVAHSQSNQWTWVKGDSSVNHYGIYGTLGISSPTNKPGGRSNSVSWTDAAGNLWIFGGTGLAASGTRGELNDLWKYNTATNQWTWIKGDSITNVNGVYGAQGISSSANKPGARWGSVSWTDLSGNLWLFGGTLFNDLWRYNIATNEWTWMKGSSLQGQGGSYGSGQFSTPGCRHNSVSWTDKTGNLWLFGGMGIVNTGGPLYVLDDTWKYNINTNEWMHVPVQGPKGRNEAISWRDTTGNLWLFGGYYSEGEGSFNSGRLNDLWKYDISTAKWIFVKGDDTYDVRGVYGTQNTPSVNNKPGARTNSVSWTDNENNLWLFGGFGRSAKDFGYLNDMWKFNIATAEWTWINGDSLPGNPGNFGVQGVTSPQNMPMAKHESVSWKDAAGNFWLFGGFKYYADNTSNFNYGYYNDLWKYASASALPVTLISFAADRIDDKTILHWKVENELAFDRYEVERSNNGRVFNKVGTLKADNSVRYSFTDYWQVKDDITQLKLFYKLKMIDKDGTSRYSKIVAVQLLPNSISNYKFTIYPNPATTSIQIHCNKKITGKVDIAITDATGKVVYRKNVETNGALISISTSQLKAGAYFIKAAWSGETFVEKFIVSK